MARREQNWSSRQQKAKDEIKLNTERDRIVRNNSVANDIRLNLPVSVQLPQAARSTSTTKILPYDTRSEIARPYVKPPPNKVCCDEDNLSCFCGPGPRVSQSVVPKSHSSSSSSNQISWGLSWTRSSSSNKSPPSSSSINQTTKQRHNRHHHNHHHHQSSQQQQVGSVVNRTDCLDPSISTLKEKKKTSDKCLSFRNDHHHHCSTDLSATTHLDQTTGSNLESVVGTSGGGFIVGAKMSEGEETADNNNSEQYSTNKRKDNDDVT